MNTRRQIDRVAVSGKWMEFWFEDGNHDPERCDESCKSYMVHHAVGLSDLTPFHILNDGYAGLWVEWDHDRPVWIGLESSPEETRIRTEISDLMAPYAGKHTFDVPDEVLERLGELTRDLDRVRQKGDGRWRWTMNELKQIAAINGSAKAEAVMRTRLLMARDRLQAICDDIENACRIEYTGWFAMLRRDGDDWTCVGCINPDNEVDLPEFDLMMPIPKPETVPEFDGF